MFTTMGRSLGRTLDRTGGGPRWRTHPSPLRPTGEHSRREAGVMAHRRRLVEPGTAVVLPVILLAVLLLAGAVFVSNQVVAMRLRIAQLEDRRLYLETGSAKLQARWNAMTAPDVIRERATLELGLIAPGDPGLVLVQVPAAVDDGRRVLGDLLADLGGGTPAQAAGDRRARSGADGAGRTSHPAAAALPNARSGR